MEMQNSLRTRIVTEARTKLNNDYTPTIGEIKANIQGRWRDVLIQHGAPAEALVNKHGPCPFCGGKDRFRFDDKEGSGSFICSQCGAGDGLEFLKRLTGNPFGSILRDLSGSNSFYKDSTVRPQKIAKIPETSKEEIQRRQQGLNEVWKNSMNFSDPISEPGHLYFENRLGQRLKSIPPVLRFHSALPYFNDGRKHGKPSAIVALVHGVDGKPVTIHRTYITKYGDKWPVPSPKKLMTPIVGGATRGGAIRLYEPSKTLAVSEGIETALAVYLATGFPTWATVSAGGMASFVPPKSVKEILIFGDLDRSRTGEWAANTLAERLVKMGKSVKIVMPEGPLPTGEKSLDWLDVYRAGEGVAA